jgi:hypothetical protein
MLHRRSDRGVSYSDRPPSDAVSMPAGCSIGAFGNAGSYIWEQTTK